MTSEVHESVQLSARADFPLVSAIMITGKTPEREWLARIAVEAFLEQSYPNKELIIVNGGDHLILGHPEIHQIQIPRASPLTLGELRNIGLNAATGEWLIQWDDDDWHASGRIAEQMRYAQDQSTAVLLRNQLRYSFRTETAFKRGVETGLAGTILHHRIIPFRYPSVNRGEDTLFLNNFPKCVVIPNSPGLYVRFYHGMNTWGERHIMRRYRNKKQVMAVSPSDRKLLVESILPRYLRRGLYPS